MKKDEEIFNFFKENPKHWEEQPSPRAWQKLDSMLDRRRSRKKRFFLVQSFAAASVVLIIGMVTALAVFDHKPSSQVQFMADQHDGAVALNDHETSIRSFNDPLIMTHSEKEVWKENDTKFHELLNKKVDEGEFLADKKLLPNKKLNLTESTTGDEQLALAEKTKAPKTSIPEAPSGKIDVVTTMPAKPTLGPTEELTLAKKPITQKDVPIVTEEESESELRDESIEGFVFTPAEKEELTADKMERLDDEDLPTLSDKSSPGWLDAESNMAYPDVPADRNKERAKKQLEESKKTHLGKSQRTNKGKGKKNSKEAKPNASAVVSPSIADGPEDQLSDVSVISPTTSNTLELDPTKDVAEYHNLNNTNNINNIRLFEWILGTWTDDSGQSVEEWKKIDELTIEGKGLFVVNGETIFTESMKIRQIENDLYFIVATDASNNEMYFKLKSYNSQQAIFENGNLSFPNQVIIQRNSDNNFSTIMKNPAPVQITPGQQNYFQNRNAISNERTYRNMKRTAN